MGTTPIEQKEPEFEAPEFKIGDVPVKNIILSESESAGEQTTVEEDYDNIMKNIAQLPFEEIAKAFFSEKFKEKYPTDVISENFVSTMEVDLKDPQPGIDSIFISRMEIRLKMSHLKAPDRMFIALYGRKGGGTVAGRVNEDAKFCSAYAATDFVIVSNFGNNLTLLKDHLSPPYSITQSEKTQNKNGKNILVGQMNPIVPKNVLHSTIQLRIPTGPAGKKQIFRTDTQSLMKSRKYLSHVVWCVWNSDPVKSMQEIDEINTLEELKKEIAE